MVRGPRDAAERPFRSPPSFVTAPSPSSPPASRPQILIVDDDAAICAAYEQILSGHGYEVVTAGSRSQAMAALDTMAGAADVLILDIGLPDVDGGDLAREISARIGPRPTLYVSGWTDEFWDLSAAPSPWLVIQKPIPIDKLLAAVDYLSGRRSTRPGDE